MKDTVAFLLGQQAKNSNSGVIVCPYTLHTLEYLTFWAGYRSLLKC